MPPITQILVAVVAIWALSGALIWLLVPTMDARGQFGDMFGAINALFSGLAFVALLYALHLQRRDIHSQELHLARSARLNAMAALISAYTERARHMDSRAAPNTAEVQQCHERIKQIAGQLEAMLKEGDA